MSRKTNHHMTADEFRRYGKEMVDWIADYYEWVETQRVLPDIEPGDIRKSLPEKPPIHGESFDVIMQDVDQFIMPGITHWQSPGFFCLFPQQHVFSVDSGGNDVSRLGATRHVLEDQSRDH